ncbi:hypothetical protein DL96DRAFT_1244586 [Flagelloscypha sp. PMI_526]|nr:hypothetical protein DL96DRAFT_1244586 [Flagelloscypha sp. PMI_526]
MSRGYSFSASVTRDEIRAVAKVTTSVLETLGFSCYLVGGAACELHGMRNRTPNDIDMAVLTTTPTETIKQMLVNANSKFFLVRSKNPRATYKVLWYSLAENSTTRLYYALHRACKVDLLTPYSSGCTIPTIPKDKISRITPNSGDYGALPVAPFMVALLLKLRAWKDHGDAYQAHYRAKKPVDRKDILELLDIAVQARTTPKGRNGWAPELLKLESESRVRAFVREVPSSRKHWNMVLGLNLKEPAVPKSDIEALTRSFQTNLRW